MWRSFRFVLARAKAPVAAALLFSSPASADLDGKWKQGPLKEDFTVQQWSKAACGAPPDSGSRGGGETVTVTVEGDLLSIVGGGRVYKSNQCYDDMPTLQRDSYQRDPSGKVWRTHCSTPPNDPRRGNINTLIQVIGDNRIEIAETGRYEIVQQAGASCVADIKRTRTLEKIAETPIATTTAPPPPTHTNACASPGEPARLEVRPSKKLLRGGESFTFGALVLDASGCATSTPTAWKIEGDARGLTVDDHGKVTAPSEGEGSVTIVVTAAGKSTKVTVDLTTAAKYDDLLKSSGLNASGETDTASVVVIAEGSIGASDVRVEGGKKKKTIFLVVIAGLIAMIGVAGVFGWRRSRRAAALQRRAEERHAERVREAEERKREKAAAHAAQLAAHEESLRKRAEAASIPVPQAKPPTICPACQREFPADSSYCPHDGNRLVPMNVGAARGPGVICPTCKRGYDPGVRTCPDDGAELVPYPAFIAKQEPTPKQGKICPTCGQRFQGDAAFCGKDGSALVLLN